MADEEYERLAYVQRLKAAVHYTVGQICEETAETMSVSFDRQFIAALSEATFRYSQTMSRDLELFAKHAKRTTINTDDVKLLVRKSPDLLDHIVRFCEQHQATTLEKKQKRVRKKPTKETTSAAADPVPVEEDD